MVNDRVETICGDAAISREHASILARESLGGVESLINHPALMTMERSHPNACVAWDH